MTFRDIRGFRSFDDFIHASKHNKPYKGTTNIYPLGKRAYRDRSFEFLGEAVRIRYHDDNIALIHSDWSIEYESDGEHGQGCHQMMSSLLGYGFSTTQYNYFQVLRYMQNIMHPIFKGLRVDLKTGNLHPECNYKLIVNRLDPVKTKPIREAVDDLFKLAVPFFMNSSEDEIKSLLCKPTLASSEFDMEATSVDPLEVVCGVIIRNNTAGLRHAAMYNPGWAERMLRSDFRKGVIETVKRQMLEECYKTKEPFRTEVLPAGSIIPKNAWGVQIFKY